MMDAKRLGASWWLGLVILLGMAAGQVAGQAGGGAEEDDPRQLQVMERFLALIEKTPRRGTALDRVYSYHVERGTIDAFLDAYRAKVSKSPDDGNTWFLLGLFEAQRGRDAAAVAALREAERLLPQNPLPSYYLGQALVMVGQPDAAAEAFERAIARNPIRADLLEIFQALGKVHQRALRFEQALAVWNRLEKLLPDDLRVQEQIALALIDEGQHAEALPRLEGLAKKVKDPHRQVQLAMDAADLKVRLGKTAEALKEFEGLLGRLNPDAWLYREARRRLEDIYLRNDDMAGLSTYYERWIKKTPDDLDAIARLGRLLALQGRSAEAREWLEKAVKLAPTRRELRIALIDQLVKQGLIAEASSQYEALAEREPGNPDTLRDWGRLLLKDSSRPEPERKAAAAKVWRRMADARKDDAVTVAQVAELFRQADMVDQALELYRKAIALAPESPQYREYLGEYYQALKRTDEAIAAWSEIASGPRRNAKSLARLSEILAGFGHLKPAIEAAKGAIALDPKELPLRIKAASFLGRDGRLKEAIAELDAAARLAETDDEKEEVLRLQIEDYQASGTLAAEIESLNRALESGEEKGAARWLRLARLWEADRRLPEAAAAVKKALALEPRSVPAWATSARLHESAGDLLSAADGYRRLVQLDRRARGEYLTNIAKLEARLGRRAEALQAGRDLLASAPGNADNYQVFADLCFQLGANDEGLDTLRRSVRLNPSDSKVLLNLAEALARQFRIDEAIEIYWRALARLDEIEAKLNAVARLADLYLQRNQFDRLIARLGRELGNPDQQRELAFCLAQAYSSAGDYGPARQELERVLATTPRDTQLLKQLSNLAETEGSLADASKYQNQLNDLAPSEEGTSRLAQLYVKSGDMTEAEALWEKISAEDEDTHRVLQAIDSLVGNGKDEAALTITGRLLRARPDDWEALYREGVALVDLDRRDEAERRFQALLALGTSDDALSAIVKARRKNFQPQAASSAWAQAYQARKYPQLYRGYASYSIRQATGLDSRNYFNNASVWSPSDFGEARMATMAWRYRLAEKSGRAEAFVKDTREAAKNAGRDARPRWDWLYLQMVRDQGKWIYEAARELARNAPDDVDAQWAMLHWLAERTTKPGGGTYRPTGVGVVETTPPLPAEEVDLILKGYRTLRLRKPEIVYNEILASVDTELKRALREKDREQLYRDALAAVVDPGSLGSALQLAAERGDVDRALELFDRFDQANPTQATIAYAFLYGSGDPLGRLMNARAQEKAHGDVTRILDHYARVMQQRTPQARRSRNLSPVNSRSYYYIWVGKNQNFTNIDFPKPNDHVDHDGIQLLRNAFELCRRDGKLPDLFNHLGRVAEKGTEIERIDARLMLGYLRWWNEERDLAVKELVEAVKIRPADPELKLSLAEIREKNDEPAEALKLVDSAEPLDKRMMQRRELLALRLSVLAGDIERARKAAERLFGLRLDVSIQSQLADQMDQLGMHELAEAILGRARRRAGNGTAALVSLMQQYQRQNRTDLAVQVALQLLRRGGSSGFNPYASFYATEEETARKEAIGTLARAGRLKAMIERLEAQVKTSPGSLPLLQNLAEYYRVDGKSAQAREVYKQILAIRPDDAKIRFQIASQLLDDGEIEATLDHFRVVLKKEPSLFRYRSDDIFKAFRQAQRLDELASLLEQVDFKTFGHPAFITPMIAELFKEKEPRLHDAALRLVRKAMDAFPNERMYVLGQVKDEAIWGLPEMLDYARTAVLPPADESLDAIWHGLDEVIEYADDGRLIGVATRLLEVAARRNALRPLLGDIEAASRRLPAWKAGQALAGAILVRLGEPDRALSLLSPIIDDPKAPMEPYIARILAQELEDHDASLPMAISMLERAVRESDEETSQYFEIHAARRLIPLYERNGRLAEARALLFKLANRKVTRYPAAITNTRVAFSNAILAGQMLIDASLPTEAAWTYQRMLDDREGLEALQALYLSGSTVAAPDDTLVRAFRERRDAALASADRRTLRRYLAATLSPPGPKEAAKALLKHSEADIGPPSTFDLMLNVQPKVLDQARLSSPLEAQFARADAPLRAAILKDLAKPRAEAPDDLSHLIVAALVGLDDGSSEAVKPTLDALSAWLDRHPLEPIPAGEHANTRQRADALPQVALWLVARRLEGRDDARAIAERLAAGALEAADRQVEPLWSLAIVREQGQLALDRNDRVLAEARWNDLLTRINRQVAAGEAVKGVPVTTPERFRQASALASLATRRGFAGLGLKALTDPLKGGPPVQPLAAMKEGAGAGSTPAKPAEESRIVVAREVEQAFAGLDPLWEASAEPKRVYESIREVVLNEARPGEIFLYERPFARGEVGRPRSVGALLVKWAARAGRLDDLKARVVARLKEPRAEVPALVLLARIGLETGDPALANESLAALAKLLTDTAAQTTAEQACHAAVPALARAETRAAALALLKATAKSLASGSGEEPLAGLSLALARHQHEQKKPDDVRKSLKAYASALDRTLSGKKGDPALSLRKGNHLRLAREQLRLGLLAEALDTLGQFAEATTPQAGDPPTGEVIAMLRLRLQALPAAERLALLKAWSLPTVERKSARVLAGLAPREVPPAAFGLGSIGDDAILGTADLLIAAAKERGALEPLAAEAEQAAAAKIANAEPLAILIGLARGKDDEAGPRLKALLARLPGKIPAEPETTPTPPAWPDILVARACLRSDSAEIKAQGEAIAKVLIDHAHKVSSDALVAPLQRELVQARAVAASGKPLGEDTANGLAHWTPMVVAPSSASEPGEALWLGDEGTRALAHVSGSGRDLLTFKAPLTGTFTVSARVSAAEFRQGHLAYGGLVFEPLRHKEMKSAFDTLLYNNTGQHSLAFRSGKVWPLNGQEPLERPCRSFGAEDEARLSLEVSPEKVRCLVNGHLFYEAEGNPATSSPWLSLYAASGRSATFRDVEIRGTPTIPSQLDLAADPRLSGWLPGVEGDTLPSWKLANEYTSDDNAHLDWSLDGEGEIRGRRLDAPTSPGVVPGLLTYHRPIQSGETVRFEFFAEPGVVEAHPALGRLGFLLEPEGVRVRWVSPHPEGDWTALEPANAVAIPGARRGPDRLPIKPREWNRAALAILDDRMTLELNGTLVYELPLAPGQSRRFGLYHDKARTSARARHIILSGPWGDSLAAEVAGKLEAPRQGVATPDPKTLDAILDRKPTPSDATARVEAPKVEHWNLSTSGKTHELIYDRPLIGDFALSAELAIAPGPVELGYGGVRFGVSDDRKHYRWSNGERKGEGALDPPLPGDKAWFKAELAIKGSEAAFSVDGRRVHAERLADRPDPWAVVRGLPASGEAVRSLGVVGEPSVPRRFDLSPLAGLSAWAIVPEPEPRGEHGPAYWAWHGEHLVGTPFYDVPGSRQESRLVYHRPMLEDGEVSYEFFAEDASRMVHPSLGETGFLLAPDGIRGVDFPRPDHDDAPRERRLTDKPLAIRPNDWNRLGLSLSGGKVTLRLNGEVILEQPWPSDAPRRFGLFHYLDETEAVVRRLAYEGAWPGSSPKP